MDAAGSGTDVLLRVELTVSPEQAMTELSSLLRWLPTAWLIFSIDAYARHSPETLPNLSVLERNRRQLQKVAQDCHNEGRPGLVRDVLKSLPR